MKRVYLYRISTTGPDTVLGVVDVQRELPAYSGWLGKLSDSSYTVYVTWLGCHIDFENDEDASAFKLKFHDLFF